MNFSHLPFIQGVLAYSGVPVNFTPTGQSRPVLETRAASSETDRLLPRYKQAVRQARVEQLALAVAAGDRVAGLSSPR